MALIFFEDGFPVVFSQKRVGLNERHFTIYKLRSMKKNTQELGTHLVNDSYILKIGAFIRKYKIDELLQLVNVLKGDINLVGPRPGLVSQNELLSERKKMNIFNIKPGITGLAQISGYDMSDPKKLAFVDNIYYKHQSFVLDFKILISTFTGIFKRDLKNKFNI